MDKVKISVEVTNETYDKMLSLVHVINYLNNNKGKEVTPEHLLKAALAHYLERFYECLTIDRYESNTLIPLGNPNYSLVIDIEDHINQLGIPLIRIAKQLNISKGTLINIIENKHQPSLDTFTRIWWLIGCPPLHEVLHRDMSKQ